MRARVKIKIKYSVIVGLLSVYAFIVSQIGFLAQAEIEIVEKRLNDGTYEGRSFKFPVQMKVLVVIKDGKIVDIKILSHLALKKYTDMMQELIGRIIKQQSTEVDAVTGATISSNALKKAVADALNKATNSPIKLLK